MTLQALSAPVPIAFTHRASYSSAPVVQVEIAATDAYGLLRARSVRVPMLVDSGADVTVMNSAYAGLIGIDLAQCQQGWIRVASGDLAPVRQAQVWMRLCGQWLDVPVNFHANTPMQLLGRRVVFDNLFLAFAQGRNAFYAARM